MHSCMIFGDDTSAYVVLLQMGMFGDLVCLQHDSSVSFDVILFLPYFCALNYVARPRAR